MPGATLGDRSTSCLGRHLCQSANDVNDNDVIDLNDDVNHVNDGDNYEAVVAQILVLRYPPDNCQWTSGENSDSPQPGNLRPISHKINI